MIKYKIENFTQKCTCSKDVNFYVVIGHNQDKNIDDLGYIAQCDSCHQGTGMLSSIHEAYDDLLSFPREYNPIHTSSLNMEANMAGDVLNERSENSETIESFILAILNDYDSKTIDTSQATFAIKRAFVLIENGEISAALDWMRQGRKHIRSLDR